MTQPAQRSDKLKVARALSRSLWVLFAIIITVIVLDKLWLASYFEMDESLVFARSFALGALLNYLSQTVFFWFAFRYSGMQARRNIVNQLYLGEISKWFITLIGFIVIFITIRPFSAGALFIGFIIMQISHSWSTSKIR